ncbi:hypothetical protein [Tenacibaculum mesophilum]|uniref:hypothetical protein n=1 Tax=Tenacibaculum mesophilum TaxID=104268 RepID=UPI00248FE0E6|nr:hypothetical protein [Tenacibaculum mesophilum]
MIKSILDYITPAHDKLKHNWQFNALFYGLLLITYVFILFSVQLSPWWAYFITVFVAAFKEVVWDWLLGNGTPELKDFLASIFYPTLTMLTIYIY